MTTNSSISMDVEGAIHFVREKPLLALFLGFVFLRLLVWASGWGKVKLPRVYVDGSSWFTRRTDIFRTFFSGDKAILKGYKEYPDGFFQYKQLGNAFVVVNRPEYLKEMFSAPEEHLSFTKPAADGLQLEYTISKSVAENQWHALVVKSELSRHIPELMPAIVDELDSAMSDEIPLTDDWTPLCAFEKAVNIVARISNRVFVGLPLCRNEEYLEYASNHAVTVVKAAQVLRFLPKIVKKLVVWILFPDITRGRRRIQQMLTPVINERLQQLQDKDFKKPTDFLQWLIDAAEGDEATTEALANRILVLNFASTFTHALYSLAAHPEYIQPLREEVESLVAEEGWTKSTVMKMRKLDSFIKETIRMHPLSHIGSGRQVMKPFTFSNGVTIPTGVVVIAPIVPIHMDERIYENPKEFDGFRFSKLREQEGESAKHHSSNTGVEYLHFGHGHHACPGRFFAVNEIKLMFAFLLLRYDVKTVVDGVRPADLNFQTAIIPNRKAKILFKKRNM